MKRANGEIKLTTQRYRNKIVKPHPLYRKSTIFIGMIMPDQTQQSPSLAIYENDSHNQMISQMAQTPQADYALYSRVQGSSNYYLTVVFLCSLIDMVITRINIK